MNQQSKIGFYFHIPFCPHICPYCDFTKTSQFQKKDVDTFFHELLLQLNHFLDLLNGGHIDYCTVYFGGGTPGLFKSHYYIPLLNRLKEFFELEEVTIETNPYTNYEKNFVDYKNAGFNRITLGAQSLCPNTLKTLGRKHTPKNILKNLEWARHAGFDNIQTDLIYGLKKEIRSLPVEEEIEQLVNAGATGISAYFLSLEKRTLFANSNLVDEEHGVEEYYKILDKCEELGLAQIETSNFSKFEAKHNNLYWYGMPYVGIGTGAHGLLPPSSENPYGIRYKIGLNIESSALGNDILNFKERDPCQKNFHVIYDKPRSKQDFIQEMIFTHLRTPKGVKLSWLKEMLSDESVHKLLKNAKFSRALSEGKMFLSNDQIFLSAKEKIRGDAWAVDFISILS